MRDKSIMKIKAIKFMAVMFCLLFSAEILAHHVLGRPAYSLNEDSNTPPSMQVETQIGEFFITYMVYPAFPKAGERGRVNLYASRIDDGKAYDGEITFHVKDDVIFGDEKSEMLGKQNIDDGVYRQGFEFKDDGKYIITAQFMYGGEPYIIDFPLQVGESAGMGPILATLVVIVLVLIIVNILQRGRLMREKIRGMREQANGASEK